MYRYHCGKNTMLDERYFQMTSEAIKRGKLP
jgi:hypothetical protein